uniref:Serine-threonine kinase receptor-associated protein n=1 Tax=Dermatophagoides pteronyssinus TaxID=6956 RepID=A0A6P6Y4H5_DERPT|nr:eukaryotic translation initiation factor 3 subunit I-like [Dermatophagoides pteronyssinus]
MEDWGPLDQSIIVGTDEGLIIVTTLQGQELHRVEAHSDSIKSVSFNQDRSVMLTVGRDKLALLWNTTTMELIGKYLMDRPLNACALNPLMDAENPDERYYHCILAGGQDASEVTTSASAQGSFETIILNLVTKEEIGRITAHYSPTTCLTYLRDGKSFVTGTYEGNCKIIALPDAFFAAEGA